MAMVVSLIDIRKDFILSLDYKFILFCIAQSISEVENENTDVGRRVNLIRKRMRRCRAGLRQFFKNLLSENASTDLFPGAIQAIYKSEESCKNHFRHLLRDHPKNIRTLRLFAEVSPLITFSFSLPFFSSLPTDRNILLRFDFGKFDYYFFL